jgi:hypothetical protein
MQIFFLSLHVSPWYRSELDQIFDLLSKPTRGICSKTLFLVDTFSFSEIALSEIYYVHALVYIEKNNIYLSVDVFPKFLVIRPK